MRMTKQRSLGVVSILTVSGTVAFCFLSAANAQAELFRFRDASGREHYVDNAAKVPDAFAATLDDLKDGRQISRAGSATYSNEPGPQRSEENTVVAARARKRIQVFVTDYCPYCRNLEAYLNERKIPYTRYNIESDPKAQIAFREIGGKGVPITQIGETVIPGFDQEAIENAIKKLR